MKKSFTKVLPVVVALCFATEAGAYDFEAEGVYFNILSETDKTVEVTSGDYAYAGSVILPSTVNSGGITYAVTAIGENAFFDCVDLTSVEIPDGVVSIGYGAFEF